MTPQQWQEKYEHDRLQKLLMPFANRLVKAVYVDSRKSYLKFEMVDGGAVYWQADGDCCSYTWIENVQSLDFKGQVLEITADGVMNGGPESVKRPDGYHVDCMAYYGLTVKSDRGRLIIDYRNDSNGYYGGNMCVADIKYMPANLVWHEVE